MDIIIDIDGTIADCSHRLQYIQQKPKQWNKFFCLITEDKPIKTTISLVQTLYYYNNIFVVTGRPEKTRIDTETWLNKNNVPFNLLFMRGNGDFRPDFEVKREALNKLMTLGYRPSVAIEDRQQCVDMYRRNGLTCLQCAPGDF